MVIEFQNDNYGKYITLELSEKSQRRLLFNYLSFFKQFRSGIKVHKKIRFVSYFIKDIC